MESKTAVDGGQVALVVPTEVFLVSLCTRKEAQLRRIWEKNREKSA